MPKFECLSCGGSYWTPQRGGRKYYHACPPVANPAFEPDPGRPDHDPRETIERADRRDETIDDSLGPGREKIRAEGKGRRVIPPLPWELELGLRAGREG